MAGTVGLKTHLTGRNTRIMAKRLNPCPKCGSKYVEVQRIYAGRLLAVCLYCHAHTKQRWKESEVVEEWNSGKLGQRRPKKEAPEGAYSL